MNTNKKKLQIIYLICVFLLGMMDIALLTANANQLRFLITYNSEEKTFYISAGLIVLSLIIQLAVGIGLIFKVSYNFHFHSPMWAMPCPNDAGKLKASD